jgi:hypothetical protein
MSLDPCLDDIDPTEQRFTAEPTVTCSERERARAQGEQGGDARQPPGF